MFTVLLPPGVNLIAVNKYMIYHGIILWPFKNSSTIAEDL